MEPGMEALIAGLAPAAGAGSAPLPLPDGAAGALPPAPMGADPAAAGMDPMMAGGMDPMAMGMQPAGMNPYPTADPNFMSEVFAQLMAMRDADHQQLAADQDEAMLSSPMFQSLVEGAPMGPGAGQDGQAIEAGAELPMPGM